MLVCPAVLVMVYMAGGQTHRLMLAISIGGKHVVSLRIGNGWWSGWHGCWHRGMDNSLAIDVHWRGIESKVRRVLLRPVGPFLMQFWHRNCITLCEIVGIRSKTLTQQQLVDIDDIDDEILEWHMVSAV